MSVHDFWSRRADSPSPLERARLATRAEAKVYYVSVVAVKVVEKLLEPERIA